MLSKVFQVHQSAPSQEAPLENETEQHNSTLENMAYTEKSFTPGSESNTCETNWSCCGENCYYFSNELKNFEDSKKFCKEMNSVLLKIADEKELNFIQNHISYFPYSSWMGLSHKGRNSYWTWEDNSRPHPKILIYWKESQSGNCGSIRGRKIVTSDCSKFMYYIYEK